MSETDQKVNHLTAAKITPAIVFEPDAYVMTGPRLLGRHSASHSFLRAAIEANRGGQMHGYTVEQKSFEIIKALVEEIDPGAQIDWIKPHDFNKLREQRILFRPDPLISSAARLRLRAGIGSYSLCGLTHTIASMAVLEEIAGLVTAPVAPWDAVICTSSVAVDTIHSVIGAEVDYVSWRLKIPVDATTPATPIIPLGVHCDDFDFSVQEKIDAREVLGVAADEIVILFAGRLTPSGKAHPVAMWRSLQIVAEQTGKKIVLIQAGRFANVQTEKLYRQACETICRDIRYLFVDGKDNDLYRQTWSAADLFISLADSVQETFGLTPIEAMAAGLPAIVSDWDGYKDTVRDGIDGFRIPTWTSGPGTGREIARDYESGLHNYDIYMSRLSTTVSMDFRALLDRITRLVTDSNLRQKMGESGKRRAREIYDWQIIYAQYESLWAELDSIRLFHLGSSEFNPWISTAPKAMPFYPDPFNAFSTFPTHHILPTTRVLIGHDISPEWYKQSLDQLFPNWRVNPVAVEKIMKELKGSEGQRVASIARKLSFPTGELQIALSRLAKIGLVRFDPPSE